jgi:DNA-binding transcriptional ArsR family regulator
MLRTLLEQPDQTVSDVARRLNVPVSVTSQYLRALNARGLLETRRSGRYVQYRPTPDKSIPEAKSLLEGLRESFARERAPIDVIFRLATAFTHPRRVEMVRALQGDGLTPDGLREKTGISQPALRRHLGKLIVRGFVVREKKVYRAAVPPGLLAKRLSEIAGLQ